MSEDSSNVEISQRESGVDKPRLERNGDVVNIYKPEGTYTIIYGYHTTFGLSIPMDPNSLPNSLNGLFIEPNIGISWKQHPLESLQSAKEFDQYAELFPKIEARKTPVIFADPRLQYGKVLPAEALLLIGETVIGTNLLANIGYNITNKRLTRRDFIKGALATWLLTPVAARLGSISSGTTKVGQKQSAEFKKLSDKVHPESDLFTTTLRNVVIAHKEDWLMNQLGNSHIGTLIGGLHASLEDQIMAKPEDRMDFLRKLKSVLNQVVDPETFSSLVTVKYDGNQWRVDSVAEVPELKSLLTR